MRRGSLNAPLKFKSPVVQESVGSSVQYCTLRQ